MATVAAPESTTTVASPRLSWGGIFAGAFVAVGVWLLLYALGLAIGLTSIDTGEPRSTRAAGIFTGWWAVLTPLVALFIGGIVGARSAGYVERTIGVIQGLTLWALTTVAGLYLVAALMTMAVGGAASMGGKALQGAASSASQAIQGAQSGTMGSAFDALGLDPDQMLQPINQRLQQQGQPTVTAKQLQDAAQDAMQRSLREGRLDREQLVVAIADKTALTRQDADQLANQVQSAFDQRAAQAKTQFEQQQKTAETGALKVANASGKAFWGVFVALALGLCASLVGGAIGARPYMRVDQV